MAGYGVKDANRMLRASKDSKPESTDCKKCDDTGVVVTATGIRACTCSQQFDFTQEMR